ncbi:MAG: SusC/RagA family TonB-linked outer membrane protein [Tannerellaceae bacterium]|nr:SusC/RagA family TonB-linked outer membrane protein [Tannerellaceae bacterium]
MVVLYSNKQAEPARTSAKQQDTKRITGVITDDFGDPVIGANVLVKGTTTGTITGLDGDFTLDVPENATLVVSYIGYVQQEVSVAGKTIINVTLNEDTQKLDEVVVTALGIKRQARSIGYSTATVGGDEFTEARDLNIGNALSGKVAGVSVAGNATGVGGSSRITIRGNASLTGNNQPLYVIDGIPFDNTNIGNAGQWGGMDMGDGLNAINPDDIAEVQVLKGAAASALYGYRGGNGAILITTKTGTQKGVNIEFNNNLTFNPIYDYRDYQEVYGQGTKGLRPTSAASAKETYSSSWGEVMGGGKTAVNFLGDEYEYTMKDNWKNFYQVGLTEQASLSVSGKSDNVTYRVGVSNVYDRSTLPNSSLSQQGINLNTTYDITSKLSLTVNANYAFDKVKGRANLSDGNGNVNATLLYLANSADVRWMEPRVDGEGNELIPGTSVYFNNPYFLQYEKTNETNRNRLTGGMTLKYDIFDWLYIQGQVTRDGYNLEFRQVQPMGAAADPGGYLNEYSRNFSEVNLNYLIGFNKKVGDFSIGATLGGNRLRNIWKQFGTSGNIKSFVVPGGSWNAGNVSDNYYEKKYEEYRVNSVYGTADFGYKDFLFLNFTGRNDWFSTLNPDTNSFFYPSVSLSFMFSEAFELPEWIYSGKLRAAYASASNGTTPYQTALYYTLEDYQLSGQSVGKISNSNIPNKYLKPVRISEWEAGLNVQFLQNRLGFDLAVYQKKTTDDIALVSTSSASGYESAIMNVGEIRNRGVELMVHGVPVRTKDFMWNSTFNFAYNKSKVLDLGGASALTIDGAEARNGGVVISNRVGEPYGQIVGYKYATDDKGNRIFDEEGYAVRSDEKEVLGNGVYKFTGGFRNDFSYKNWSLGFLLDYKFGAKIFSGTNLSLYSSGLHKETLAGREDGIVGVGINEVTGTTNTVRVDAQDYWDKVIEREIAEDFVYDASFIKLRELSVGYTFPSAMLKSTKVIKSVTLSLVGRNLWTIMKHTPNIDPESSINNTNGQGLELNGYPITRNIGFNVNVKF